MTNKAVARHLKLAADLIELTGGNAFRARAYASAARRIEQLPEAVEALASADELTDVAGVGKGLAAEVAELIETGRLPAVTEILQTLPPGLLDVLRVKGLGPKKVRTLWQELEVTSLDALEAAAVAGRIAELPGFGKKTQQNVLDQIERLQAYAGKAHYAQVADEVEALLRALRASEDVGRADVAGAFRRQLEVVEAVEVVVEASAEAATRALAALGVAVQPDGDGVLRGPLPFGLPLVVHPATRAHYGRVLWAATGSEAHVEAFVERHGMPGETGDEEVVYTSAGLPFVPPALREGTGEIEAAAEGRLPHLITVEDFRGTLHNHTTASDGTASLREMAEAARALGLDYIAICDHSQSLKIANGLSVERLMAQVEEIERLNAEYAAAGVGFRVFSGTECDVLRDGALDYPDDVLERLDFVVASIHSLFKLGVEEQTARLVRAAENPHVDVLGHPTGRLLLRRDGYAIDHEAVIEACARTGTALELNANPWRLDVDWRWLRRATEAGVLVAINPDAHSTGELENVRWGVSVAQKGWLTPEQCLNTRSTEAFAAWLDGRRTTDGGPRTTPPIAHRPS
ncbi:MAG TPA: helix-hairpin-helix domain-containing protein [Rubricoccaceae bacterium]|nr:helix-hairpin-helix domain-containing protein [Rubricoccaceae bacterium]